MKRAKVYGLFSWLCFSGADSLSRQTPITWLITGAWVPRDAQPISIHVFYAPREYFDYRIFWIFCYFDYRINKPFTCSRCFICVSNSVHVISTYYASKGLWALFTLITHKSMGSENPITRSGYLSILPVIYRCMCLALEISIVTSKTVYFGIMKKNKNEKTWLW